MSNFAMRGVGKLNQMQKAYPKIAEYPEHAHDDDTWPDGSEMLCVPTWPVFLEVWKKHFPLMRVRKQSKDVCGECLIYKNSVKFALARKRKEKEERALTSYDGNSSNNGSSSDDDDDNNDNGSIFGNVFYNDGESNKNDGNGGGDGSNEEQSNDIDDEDYLAEIVFMQANEHVDKARAKRELAREKWTKRMPIGKGI